MQDLSEGVEVFDEIGLVVLVVELEACEWEPLVEGWDSDARPLLEVTPLLLEEIEAELVEAVLDDCRLAGSCCP
jgi:hypothetical protein